ncbi:MAG: SUMF1/EgtB/PvdO family nonheme iron enzyme [Nitrospinae bacterium]|nr:SUMF1/EgtB/PvdO family nonheme iron enzyme [Nitrospinota bacterium]
MGSNASPDETPHPIYLSAFRIDRYEVTQEKFEKVMADNPSDFSGAHRPVERVTWYEARDYCKQLGKRLPTEAEWEKAARGPKGNIFPWGNNFNWDAANISHSSKKRAGHQLKPVGSFPEGASPYGVHDMIGNAWEWVWDYYLPYPNSEYESKDFGKKYVVVRGLSYLGVGHFPKKSYKKVVALKARASYRERLNPFVRKKDVGFRCAKDKPPLFKKATEKKREI